MLRPTLSLHLIDRVVPAVAAALLLLGVLPGLAMAQQATFDFTSAGTVYDEDFDSLPNDEAGGVEQWFDGDSITFTLGAWYAQIVGASETLLPDDGEDVTAGFRSYGDDLDSDRALGAFNDAPGAVRAWGVRFRNDTGQMIQTVDVTCFAEHWRNGDFDAMGGDEQQLILYSRVGGNDFDLAASPGSWTQRLMVDLVDDTGGVGARDGNTNRQLMQSPSPVEVRVPDGEDFWIGFLLAGVDDGGMTPVDNNHGVGIDDMTVAITITSAAVTNEDFDGVTTGNPVTDDADWVLVSGVSPIVTDGQLIIDGAATAGEVSFGMFTDTFGDPSGAVPVNQIIYAGFTLRMTSIPANDVPILAYTEDSAGGAPLGHVWVTANRRLGVSVGDAAPVDTVSSAALTVGIDYIVMLRLDMTIDDDPKASVWLNPEDEDDAVNRADADDAPVTVDSEVNYMSFYQSDTGAFAIDFLKIARDFPNARPTLLTVTPANPEDQDVPTLAEDIGVLGFDCTATGGNVFITTVSFTGGGNGHDVNDLTSVELWGDDGSGTFDSELDSPISNNVYSTDPGMLTLPANREVPVNETRTFFIVYDFASPAVGRTFTVTLTDVAFSGGLTTGLPQSGATITIDEPILDFDPANPAPDPLLVEPGETGVIAMRFEAFADGGDVSLDTIELTPSGLGHDANDITSLQLVHDMNVNGVVETGETLLTTTWDDDNTAKTFDVNTTIDGDTAAFFLIVYDFAPGVTIGDDFTVQLTDATVTGGQLEGLPISGRTLQTVRKLVFSSSELRDGNDIVDLPSNGEGIDVVPGTMTVEIDGSVATIESVTLTVTGLRVGGALDNLPELRIERVVGSDRQLVGTPVTLPIDGQGGDVEVVYDFDSANGLITGGPTSFAIVVHSDRPETLSFEATTAVVSGATPVGLPTPLGELVSANLSRNGDEQADRLPGLLLLACASLMLLRLRRR